MAPPPKKPKTPRPELARKRRAAGYSQTSFAKAIHASPQAVRQWEQGVAEPSIGFRRPIAQTLGTSMAEVDRLIDGRPPDLDGQALNGGAGLNLFVKAEQSAHRAQVVDLLHLPALVQTRPYALALERTYHQRFTETELHQRVDARVSRAAVLDREPEPLEFSALIPWYVIEKVRGSRQIMAEQMTHLLDLAGRPNVQILVVPNEPETISAPTSFELLTTNGQVIPDVGGTDGFRGTAYAEHADDMAELAAIFDDIAKCSLTATASIDHIRSAREKYRR
jgi:transcriptional regulator with XRE-family HTH domain